MTGSCSGCGWWIGHSAECSVLKEELRFVDQQFAKRHPSSQRFHNIMAQLCALHDKKQRDYGTDEDPFNNIRASAKEWGIPAWVGAMLRATDKVRRLQKFADTGMLTNESVIDAFDDLAVYAVIARVMYEEALRDADDEPDVWTS